MGIDEARNRDAVRGLLKRMADAVNRGATDELRDIWHLNARQLAPNAPILIGRENLLYGADAWLSEWSHDMTVQCDEVQIAGVWAFASGTLTLRSVPHKKSETQLLDGKFLAILIRDDCRSWRLYRYCYNSSVPLAEG